MTDYEPIEFCQNQLEKAEGEVVYWKKELAKAKGMKMLACTSCKKKSRINNWKAQLQYHTEDGGYCIGDRRVSTDWTLICPKCGSNPYKADQDFIKEHEHSFKEYNWKDPNTEGR